MRDSSSQAGQEVPLVLLVVSPLDEHRLYASAQQVGAWTNKADMDAQAGVPYVEANHKLK